jgi:hypothetical protein
MEESREEVDLLLNLLGMEAQVRVEDGAPDALPDVATPVESAGTRLIVEEAMRRAGRRSWSLSWAGAYGAVP